MAHRTVLVDDIDGKPAEETVAFGLDGLTYEIDLSASNAAAIRADFARWIEAGRRDQPGGRHREPKAADMRRMPIEPVVIAPSARTLREWARANGYDVNPKGRVAQHIVDAFHAAT